jgi:RNA polymerase sigma-70 factor (ECF subfamily)
MISVPWSRRRRDAATARESRIEAEISVEHRSDEDLFGSYLDGDREAFAAIVQRYSDELVQFLTKLTGTRAAAEDVFQEAFLQVHQSAATFDVSRRIKPWLSTIAVNKGRDDHRRNARRKAVSLSASIESSGEGQSFADLLDSGVDQPWEGMMDTESRARVKRVVDDLPENFREILLLSYYQKMSYSQIADALEIPLGTVKSRLHSAVAAFGRNIGAEEADAEEGEQ